MEVAFEFSIDYDAELMQPALEFPVDMISSGCSLLWNSPSI